MRNRALEQGRPTLADSVEGYCLAVDMMLTFLIAGRPAEAVALYEARKQIEKAKKMSYAELVFVAEDPLLDKL